MSKQINLVINGKGGVGKSFFATNFVQYLKDRGIAHRALDTDHENSTLKRFHPEAEFINLEHRRGIDRVFTLRRHATCWSSTAAPPRPTCSSTSSPRSACPKF